MTQHAPLTSERARKWIDGINAARRPEQRIDSQTLHNSCGADRAERENPDPKPTEQQPVQTGPSLS